MRLALTIAILAAAALAASASLAAGGTRATTDCGKVAYRTGGKTYAYSVRRDKGSTTCRRARTIMRTFIVSASYPKNWLCVRGHRSQGQRWAASCSNTSGALLRAFGPLKS